MDPQLVNLILGLVWPVVVFLLGGVTLLQSAGWQERYLASKERLQQRDVPRQEPRGPVPQNMPPRSGEAGGDQDHIGAGNSYEAVTQLVALAENTSWNRLSAFLIANSILLVAWAALFQNANKGTELWSVQVGICVLGALLSALWVPFGVRSRRYLEIYVRLARDLENRVQPGTRLYTEAERAERQDFTRLESIGRSQVVLPLVPLLFCAGYLSLLFHPMDLMPLPVVGILLVLGIVGAVYLYRSVAKERR